MWEKFKYASELWNYLSYCIFMGDWDKARNISERIEVFTAEHPIIGFFARWLHVWV